MICAHSPQEAITQVVVVVRAATHFDLNKPDKGPTSPFPPLPLGGVWKGYKAQVREIVIAMRTLRDVGGRDYKGS